ncbi:MAG: gluconate kinase [Chthoniobacterales bacterium]|nr:MAG: gluconate kinase [Chthoniobacterales bacterium]
MIVIVFGVSGAGKTLIGRMLAQERGWIFDDADDFHPPANIAKMKRGQALTDADREPWLEKLRLRLHDHLSRGENTVLACSALKQSYRRLLRIDPGVRFVYLHGDERLLEQRLHNRRGHFMNPDLLESQFEALEEPRPEEPVIVVEVDRTPREIVTEIHTRLAAVDG